MAVKLRFDILGYYFFGLLAFSLSINEFFLVGAFFDFPTPNFISLVESHKTNLD